MDYQIGDFIDYKTKDFKGEEYIVPTQIVNIGKHVGKYVVKSHPDEEVDGDLLELNLRPNFYINPFDLSNTEKRNHSREFLIDRVVSVLNRTISEANVYREMETIVIKLDSVMSVKGLIEEEILTLYNEKVEQVDIAIMEKHFGEQIQVLLKIDFAYTGLDLGFINI